MAFLPEQPNWPSHRSADKLGMNLFTATNERTVSLHRTPQRIILNAAKILRNGAARYDGLTATDRRVSGRERPGRGVV